MTKHIGHYEVVSELGRGGMGVVYKAREESLQRFVAIKMLGNQLVENESVSARFMREARAVADLNHPNLVQVFAVDRHEDQPYFVMEYVEGESLKTLIQRERRMQPMRALQILKEVAEGLVAAHDKGVIHRDIKPENIMLTRYGGVKVVDFGIARVDEPGTRLTTTGIGLGTPSYLSPEVCLSQDVDQRSDIFSLGVVLFEMLTGDTPFKSDSPFELMTKVVEAKIPEIKELNPSVDEGVRQILAKMIAKRPKLRYQNCNELIGDIEDYQAGRVPRWARDMPVEVESGESGMPADAPDSEDTGGVAVIDEATASTDAGVAATDATRAQEDSEPAPTIALAGDSPRRGGRGRLAWVVALAVVLAGGAVAGSWYVLTNDDLDLPGLAELVPGGQPEPGSGADDPVARAETLKAGSTDSADSGDDATGAFGPGRVDELATADTEAAAPGDTPTAAGRDESATMRTEADGIVANETGDSGESDFAARDAETNNEPAVSGNQPAESGSGTPDPGRDVGGEESSADSRRLATAVETPSGGATEPDGLQGMPPAPRVAVVAVGDTAVTSGVARVFKRDLSQAAFEVVDEKLIDGLAYAESLPGVVRTVRDHGADVLIYADVVHAGESELVYYGRREPRYLATLEVRVIDLHEQRNLGPPVAEKLEYVALTADSEARKTATPIARNVVDRLRAMGTGEESD